MSHPTIERLQRGLYEALSGVADDVAWAGGEQPRDVGSLLSLSIEASSSRVLSQLSLFPAESLEIEITDATEGALVAIDLNGFTMRHTVPAAATIETVRDAVMARLELVEPDITVAAVGTDKIALSSDDAAGRIWGFAASGAAEVVEDSTAILDDAVAVTFSRETYEVTLEAFSRSREPRRSAHAIITEARARLRSLSHLEALALWGTQLWVESDAFDISAIAGAHWESRVRLPIQAAIRAVSVEPVHVIESAEIEVVASATV